MVKPQIRDVVKQILCIGKYFIGVLLLVLPCLKGTNIAFEALSNLKSCAWGKLVDLMLLLYFKFG